MLLKKDSHCIAGRERMGELAHRVMLMYGEIESSLLAS